ncbi:MAG TPA: hypothetical protein VGM03_14835 [Phycisphaerae bacterium]
MKRRAVVRNTVLAALGIVAVGLIAWPVYAHCGVCAGSAKDMVAAMDGGKTTLAKVIPTAEASSKGRAVKATCYMEGKNMEYHVYCLVGDMLKRVELDSTGKVTESEDVKTIADAGDHDEKHEHKEGIKK